MNTLLRLGTMIQRSALPLILRDAYNNRGLTKSSLSEYFAAIRDYDTAIRLNPDNAIAHANRGISMYSLGRNMEAKQDWNIALKLATEAGDVELKASIEGYLRQLK